MSTICAPATASGGAMAVIRISGPQAISITSRIFSKNILDAKGYTLHYGWIKSVDTVQGNTSPHSADASATAGRGAIIDDVVVAVFRAPHSYTGEDVVEISCHGSHYITQKIMETLLACGAEMAAPGEFTKRAFLAGKMDLSQAEAVADLIASSSAATHRLAVNQMRGGFSQELKNLRDQLLHITSLMELELDFSDHEELEFANRDELCLLADKISLTIARLAQSFHVGNALKNGIPVAIIGETNAGKSTLLNALLHEEKAIVSDIHGTTRDVIEDTINLHGISFRFIDTAGIRQTTDTIENLGIERTYQKMDQADIILWIIDAPTMINAMQNEEASHKLCCASGQSPLITKINCDANPIPAEKTSTDSCKANTESSKTSTDSSKASTDSCKASTDSSNAYTNSCQTNPDSNLSTCNAAHNHDTRGSLIHEAPLPHHALAELKDTILPHCTDKHLILVFNKCDLLPTAQQEALLQSFSDIQADKLFISAKEHIHLDTLESKLLQATNLPEISQNDIIVTNMRHYEALCHALDSIHRVQQGLQMSLSGDLVSEDLRQCIFHLSDIAGDVTTDQVLSNIFKNFCIGK